MRTLLILVAVFGLAFVFAGEAQAQVTYVPTTVYYQTPTVAAVPQVTFRAPQVTYYAPTTTYYAPAPVTTYYAPAPVTTFYAPAAVQVARPVVIGRGIVGQPKAYVPGQPIRNALRFVTP